MTLDRHAWRTELARRRPPRVCDSDVRLVLLGTAGGANAKATRCGYANAVVVGRAAYVVDCGEGVHRQLFRAGIAPSRRTGGGHPCLEAVAITHLHADHVVDLINLLQGGWPTEPIDIYGPGPAGPPFTTVADPVHPVRFGDDPAPGVRRMLDHLNRALAMNINARIIGEHRADYVDNVRVHEIGLAGEVSGETSGDVSSAVSGAVSGAVSSAVSGAASGAADIVVPVDPAMIERSVEGYEVPTIEPFLVRPTDRHGVTITATLVQHAPAFPALAFRFDTPGGSVVFSGDTGPCDNVVLLARGADVLVHEVIDLDELGPKLARLPNAEQARLQLARTHTSVGEVAAIAHRAGVATLVLSHLVPGEGTHSTRRWEELARAGCPEFAGDIVCGVDLDELALQKGSEPFCRAGRGVGGE